MVGQWEVVFPNPGTFTFSGPSTLQQSGIQINCTLSLFAELRYVSPDEIEVSVFDGSIIGGGLCITASLLNFP